MHNRVYCDIRLINKYPDTWIGLQRNIGNQENKIASRITTALIKSESLLFALEFYLISTFCNRSLRRFIYDRLNKTNPIKFELAIRQYVKSHAMEFIGV